MRKGTLPFCTERQQLLSPKATLDVGATAGRLERQPKSRGGVCGSRLCARQVSNKHEGASLSLRSPAVNDAP